MPTEVQVICKPKSDAHSLLCVRRQHHGIWYTVKVFDDKEDPDAAEHAEIFARQLRLSNSHWPFLARVE